MGLAFKENCPDLRNSKIVDLIRGFEDFNCNVDVYDPWVNKTEAFKEYEIELIDGPCDSKYDAIVLAVSHDEFKNMKIEQYMSFCKEKHVIYDIKYILNASQSSGRL